MRSCAGAATFALYVRGLMFPKGGSASTAIALGEYFYIVCTNALEMRDGLLLDKL